MKFTFGTHAAEARRGNHVDVVWDPSELINGHMLVMGDSGTGKTHLLRQLISELQASSDQPPRFHIFDVHGDLDVPGASSVTFSESSWYGFNPLWLNPDPHFGGVRRCVQNFISNLNRTSHKLGARQEAVLRNVLIDTFIARGFLPDNPATWAPEPERIPMSLDPSRIYIDVPYEEREAAKELGAQWDKDVRCWHVGEYSGAATQWPRKCWGRTLPTLEDALRTANHQLRRLFLGANQEAINRLEEVGKAADALRKKVIAARKRGQDLDEATLREEQLGKVMDRAIAAYEGYVRTICTGRELDTLLRYSSAEVLRSVIDRLGNMSATGIFRSDPPPFDHKASIFRYDIRALSEDEKKLFVDFRLGMMFSKMSQRGHVEGIRDVVILDEAKIFVSDDPDHIVNKMALESRKFGGAMILSSQSPGHFTDDLLSTVGTKIVLGLDRLHWAWAVRNLGCGEDLLKWIVPRQRIGVHMKKAGVTGTGFKWVYLPTAQIDDAPPARMAAGERT